MAWYSLTIRTADGEFETPPIEADSDDEAGLEPSAKWPYLNFSRASLVPMWHHDTQLRQHREGACQP